MGYRERTGAGVVNGDRHPRAAERPDERDHPAEERPAEEQVDHEDRPLTGMLSPCANCARQEVHRERKEHE